MCNGVNMKYINYLALSLSALIYLPAISMEKKRPLETKGNLLTKAPKIVDYKSDQNIINLVGAKEEDDELAAVLKYSKQIADEEPAHTNALQNEQDNFINLTNDDKQAKEDQELAELLEFTQQISDDEPGHTNALQNEQDNIINLTNDESKVKEDEELAELLKFTQQIGEEPTQASTPQNNETIVDFYEETSAPNEESALIAQGNCTDPKCKAGLQKDAMHIWKFHGNGAQEIRCPECDETMAIRDLSAHSFSIHNKRIAKKVKCTHCDKSMLRSNIFKHKAKFHNEEEPQ